MADVAAHAVCPVQQHPPGSTGRTVEYPAVLRGMSVRPAYSAKDTYEPHCSLLTLSRFCMPRILLVKSENYSGCSERIVNFLQTQKEMKVGQLLRTRLKRTGILYFGREAGMPCSHGTVSDF